MYAKDTTFTCIVEALVLLVVAALGHVLLPAAVRVLLVVPEGDRVAQGPVALAQVHIVNVHGRSRLWRGLTTSKVLFSPLVSCSALGFWSLTCSSTRGCSQFFSWLLGQMGHTPRIIAIN